MNAKFLLGSLLVVPLLPIMYVQGKRIKAAIPSLPEAQGTHGITEVGASETLSLITIGESTIAGVGVETHEEGFTGALSRSLAEATKKNIRWQVYAQSGFTLAKVTATIIPTIKEEATDLIVIGMGGNNAFELNSPDRWRRDSIKLIQSLRSKFEQTPIVFANMPPIKDFPAFTPLLKAVAGNLVELYAQELEKLCGNYSNVLFNSEIITLSKWIERLDYRYTPQDFFSDGVHPSKLTYEKWAQETSEFIGKKVAL